MLENCLFISRKLYQRHLPLPFPCTGTTPLTNNTSKMPSNAITLGKLSTQRLSHSQVLNEGLQFVSLFLIHFREPSCELLYADKESAKSPTLIFVWFVELTGVWRMRRWAADVNRVSHVIKSSQGDDRRVSPGTHFIQNRAKSLNGGLIFPISQYGVLFLPPFSSTVLKRGVLKCSIFCSCH